MSAGHGARAMSKGHGANSRHVRPKGGYGAHITTPITPSVEELTKGSSRLLCRIFCRPIVCPRENRHFFERPYLGPRTAPEHALWWDPRGGPWVPPDQIWGKLNLPISRKNGLNRKLRTQISPKPEVVKGSNLVGRCGRRRPATLRD